MEMKVESEKVGFNVELKKLNIQKMKIMASGPITSKARNSTLNAIMKLIIRAILRLIC